MKIKAAIFLTVYITVSVISCSSLGRTDQTDPVEPANERVKPSAEQQLNLPDGWIYEEEITNLGSRSEGSISRLFYRYNEVPPVFGKINIDGTVFSYLPMVNIWDKYGYIIDNTGVLTTAGTETLSRSQISTGWYTTEDGERYTGTPDGWIYIETDVLKAWVSADKLTSFIRFYALDSISGEPQMLAPEKDNE